MSKFKKGDPIYSREYGNGYVYKVEGDGETYPIIVHFNSGQKVSYTFSGRKYTSAPISLEHREEKEVKVRIEKSYKVTMNLNKAEMEAIIVCLRTGKVGDSEAKVADALASELQRQMEAK